jgi:hypothetical protein
MKCIKLIVLILLLASCSNSDDPNSAPTSIIGIWKPVKGVEVCSTGSKEIFQYSTCHQQSRYTFKEDGTLIIIDYNLVFGICDITYNETGIWILTGENFTITIDGETSNPTFFELTNNILRIGYYDAEPNEPCENGNLPSHYYTEFIRVE